MTDTGWLCVTILGIIALVVGVLYGHSYLEFELKALCLEVGGSLQADGACLPKQRVP